mmetsp:Transcript_25190/g.60595  ORF Transcript_25190/g.60595 Transcript_25190/m.60595 type:complete len:125 (+) Transcript_25190:101-475(+)
MALESGASVTRVDHGIKRFLLGCSSSDLLRACDGGIIRIIIVFDRDVDRDLVHNGICGSCCSFSMSMPSPRRPLLRNLRKKPSRHFHIRIFLSANNFLFLLPSACGIIYYSVPSSASTARRRDG